MLTSGYNADELSSRFDARGLTGFLQNSYGRDDLLAKVDEATARLA